MATLDDVIASYEELMALPHEEREGRVDEFAALARSVGNDEWIFEACVQQVTTYGHSGAPDPERELGPFTQMVRYLDAQPEWLTHRELHLVLWAFKEIVGIALRDPRFSRAQIEELMRAMEERYRRFQRGALHAARASFQAALREGNPSLAMRASGVIVRTRDVEDGPDAAIAELDQMHAAMNAAFPAESGYLDALRDSRAGEILAARERYPEGIALLERARERFDAAGKHSTAIVTLIDLAEAHAACGLEPEPIFRDALARARAEAPHLMQNVVGPYCTWLHAQWREDEADALWRETHPGEPT